MAHPLKKIAVALVALPGCFAAHALFSASGAEIVAAAQVDQLTRALAVCPELSTEAARRLDDSGGVLTHDAWQGLMQESRHCARQRRQLPPTAHYRLAYSGLKGLLSEQAAIRAPATGAGLKLSLELSPPAPR